MKKYILPCLLLLTAIISCNQNPKSVSTENQSADTSVYKTVSFFKTSSECDKDTCGAYVTATYPEFQDKSLNDFVIKLITEKPFDSVAHADMNTAADLFIDDYLNFKKEYPESAGGYEWIQNLEVSYEDKNLINFTHSNYVYTGGAHGLENIIYHNLSKPSLKSLTLDNLFTSGYKDKLTVIAERIFRKDEKISENEPLSDNYFFENGKFSLNDNFLITPNGLLFTYNPYEIKAYVYGNTDLLIPYNEIKDLVKPDGILSNFY